MRLAHRLNLIDLLIAALLMIGAGRLSMGQQDTTDPSLSSQIIETQDGTWCSATVFTHAIWDDLLFYGGGSGSDGGDPRHEIEIGVLDLAENRRLLNDIRNPVITRAQFGLDKPGSGITPLSILEVADTLYMFCTSRPDDDLNPRIVVITAQAGQPLEWNNYSIVIDESLSGRRDNHGASAIVNPDNPSEVLIYFAACTPPEEYRILLASVPIDRISEKRSYSLVKSYEQAVLKRDNAKANYPSVHYDNDRQQYELWYSGHTRAGSKTRSCFVSISKRKDAFEPAAEPVVGPSGQAQRNDNVYATAPQLYQGRLYYSGRKDAGGTYGGIFMLPAPSAGSVQARNQTP